MIIIVPNVDPNTVVIIPTMPTTEATGCIMVINTKKPNRGNFFIFIYLFFLI